MLLPESLSFSSSSLLRVKNWGKSFMLRNRKYILCKKYTHMAYVWCWLNKKMKGLKAIFTILVFFSHNPSRTLMQMQICFSVIIPYSLFYIYARVFILQKKNRISFMLYSSACLFDIKNNNVGRVRKSKVAWLHRMSFSCKIKKDKRKKMKKNERKKVKERNI